MLLSKWCKFEKWYTCISVCTLVTFCSGHQKADFPVESLIYCIQLKFCGKVLILINWQDYHRLCRVLFQEYLILSVMLILQCLDHSVIIHKRRMYLLDWLQLISHWLKAIVSVALDSVQTSL